MKYILASIVFHLSLVLSSPTPTLKDRPTVARDVGDTTSITLSENQVWTLTVTIADNLDQAYDNNDVGSLQVAFASAINSAASGEDDVTATYTDAISNMYSLNLMLDDGVTIGSYDRGNWTVVSAVFLNWLDAQDGPQTFTAKCTDDNNDGAEIGFYEFYFKPKPPMMTL